MANKEIIIFKQEMARKKAILIAERRQEIVKQGAAVIRHLLRSSYPFLLGTRRRK
tara:strand:+ start:364 stop:528 length:165 start_codon:yes stop_codon:yes gene_type:complete